MVASSIFRPVAHTHTHWLEISIEESRSNSVCKVLLLLRCELNLLGSEEGPPRPPPSLTTIPLVVYFLEHKNDPTPTAICCSACTRSLILVRHGVIDTIAALYGVPRASKNPPPSPLPTFTPQILAMATVVAVLAVAELSAMGRRDTKFCPPPAGVGHYRDAD